MTLAPDGDDTPHTPEILDGTPRAVALQALERHESGIHVGMGTGLASASVTRVDFRGVGEGWGGEEGRGPAGIGHGQPFARLCASSCRNCWNWAGLEV